MLTVRTYEEWRELKRRIPADSEGDTNEEMVECGECGGSGEMIDHGEVTGREFETECIHCDGEGKVPASEQASSEDSKFHTFHDYESELKLDLGMLSAWTHKPYWELLFQAGFEVSFLVESRELVATLPWNSGGLA